MIKKNPQELNFAYLDIYRENYYIHISTLWFA